MCPRSEVLNHVSRNTSGVLQQASRLPGERVAAMWLSTKSLAVGNAIAGAYNQEIAACLDSIGRVRFADWEALKLLAGAKAPKLEAAE